MATDKEIIYPIIEGSGPDGILIPGDDVKPEVKKKMGDYLSKITKEAKNDFPIEPGSTEASKDPNVVKGAEKSFAGNDHSLSKYSDSGLIFTPTIQDYINKTTDGNDVLRNIEPNTQNTGKTSSPNTSNNKIQTAISNALKKNRFSPEIGSPFIEDGSLTSVISTEQKIFGAYDANARDITFEQLSKVGKSLAIKATGEFIDDLDPDSASAGLAALIPGKAQLGATRLNVEDLQARNAFGAPSYTKTEGDLRISGQKSYGQLNNFIEPFAGFLPVGMTILSGVLIIALKVATAALLTILGILVKPNSEKNSVPGHGPFVHGQYGRIEQTGGLITLRDIGIIHTERDFLICVDKGTQIFLKFDTRSPGFYVNTIRSIIKSGNEIVNDVKNAFKPGINPIVAAQSVIGIVSVIKSSKIVAFLNAMAQIGDKALEIEAQGFSENDKIISTSDKFIENGATRVMKSQRSDMKTSWRNSAHPSKYLLPTNIITADRLFGGLSANSSLVAQAGLAGKIAKESEISNNRIKPEIVEQIENELESEYVPFYFHDIRTNQIISFPAFLTSMDNNFTANYENTNAYGRVDPIRTYKETERTLNFGFMIAATNKEDFDEMWWKINLLTTFVYPQWSEGKQVLGKFNNKDVKFIQPFSQIPTASPLIRIRIGDVIKSNYSRFNLARIFGFGTDKNDIAQLNENISSIETDRKAVELERNRMLADPANIQKVNNGKFGYIAGDVAILSPKVFNGYVEAVSAADLFGSISRGRLLSLESRRLRLTSDTKVKIIKGPNEDSSLIRNYGEKKISYYTIQVLNAKSEEQQGDWLVSHGDLSPSLDDLAAIVLGKNNLTENLDFDNESGGFLTNQNSIVKSFESTRGRGLAGFISNLSFTEMHSSVWETSEYGSRAPKLIKVTIAFLPVHDIAPGIDSFGGNRAPLFPVGNVVRSIGRDPYENNDGREKFDSDHLEAGKSIGKKIE